MALPLPIAATVAAIELSGDSARFLTYLALVAVPPLAALALAAIVRGAWPPLALLAVPLFALAWGFEGAFGGHVAALVLSALACVSLGWLLVCVVPGHWVKLGIFALAAIDAYLIGADMLQGPNATLNAAAPGAGLPKLQLAHFDPAVMGFGDLFVAATLGALLAADRRLQLTGAALAAAIGISFDFLFFTLDSLPATVPIALTLAVLEIAGRSRPGGSSELGQEKAENGQHAGDEG